MFVADVSIPTLRYSMPPLDFVGFKTRKGLCLHNQENVKMIENCPPPKKKNFFSNALSVIHYKPRSHGLQHTSHRCQTKTSYITTEEKNSASIKQERMNENREQ